MLQTKEKSLYIYGETFIKTKYFLYAISSYSMVYSPKIKYDFYIHVDGFLSKAKGKTNTYTFFDGNEHITELRDKKNPPLFNHIKEGTKLYNALLQRINFKG